jgi:hypothetical protein
VLLVGGEAVGAGLVQEHAHLFDVFGVLGVGQRSPVRLTGDLRIGGVAAAQPGLGWPRRAVGFDW